MTANAFDHYSEARMLIRAIEERKLTEDGCAALAGAHATLALYDLIWRDDESEQLQVRIADLEDQLEGARAALRNREIGIDTEMKEAK